MFTYAIDTQIYLPFDNSLIELVNGEIFIPDSSPTYSTAVFNNGLNLSDLSVGSSALNYLSTAFTIGFWLKSTNPGMVTNPITGATESLKIPVLSKSVFNYSTLSKTTTAGWNKFIIWEETNINGQNVLKVNVNGSTSSTLTSNPYTTGVFHHFWITYNGTSSSPFVILYVDTVLDSYNFGTGSWGTVPSSLTSSSASFGINLGVVGAQYNTALNQGVIDDLVVFNSSRNDINDVVRAYSLGVNYLITELLTTVNEIDQAIIFNDPSTLQITSMFGNHGSIYAGRNDGKILKGTRTLWQSSKNFSNTNELDSLSITTKSTTNNLQQQNGYLNITNAIITI